MDSNKCLFVYDVKEPLTLDEQYTQHLKYCPYHPDHHPNRKQFFLAMVAELDHAYAKHGVGTWGRHEFYGVLKEEVDELWDVIKTDGSTEHLLEELVQVAAMCLRYAETQDRHRGVHPPIPIREITPEERQKLSDQFHYREWSNA